jgi:hypothetical protein
LAPAWLAGLFPDGKLGRVTAALVIQRSALCIGRTWGVWILTWTVDYQHCPEGPGWAGSGARCSGHRLIVATRTAVALRWLMPAVWKTRSAPVCGGALTPPHPGCCSARTLTIEGVHHSATTLRTPDRNAFKILPTGIPRSSLCRMGCSECTR